MRKKLMILVVAITVVAGFIGAKVYDNRERNLGGEFARYTEQVRGMSFHLEKHPEGWRTREAKPVEELQEFLGRYQVKKMKDDDWDPDVSREHGFTVDISNGHKSLHAHVMEHRIMWRHGYFYVLNGPIDMEWVEDFNEKYGE